ncbi:ABC transporter ATP-binding protein [Streptomyces sp. NPDC050704]|uniref:ABC transporter ATP-binding protein n=1 Tax=Streptomyces sp. NPDC050704 TaxID=3157219 RepID=UPI003437610A
MTDPKKPDARLLELRHVRVDLDRDGKRSRVIHDVSLSIDEGESLGLVGESGSGKSMTTRAVMRLLPRGAQLDGEVLFRGRSVPGMSRTELADYRSSHVGMIYQDPRAHTNPLLTVGEFLLEGVTSRKAMSRPEATELAVRLLAEVGMDDGPRRMRQYPHQLSGGLLQRVMIVMALMTSPDLILADEPTTALDVTVQSDVMAILDEQRRDRRLGMLFITHDLDLAASVTDRLAVMYAGVVVENGPADLVHEQPGHPYTAALLASRPSPVERRPLVAIPGRPASAFEVGPGCVFVDRCPFAQQICRDERPRLEPRSGRLVACHRTAEIADQAFMEVRA